MKKIIVSILSFTFGLVLSTNSFAQKMYWTDNGDSKVQNADSDGSNVQDLITGVNYQGMALDLTNSKMYLCFQSGGKIQRADLDGSNTVDLISSGFPNNIALDLTNSKMYWVDQNNNSIKRADLDGSNLETIFFNTGFDLQELALDLNNSKVYFGRLNSNLGFPPVFFGEIYRMDFDGSNVEELVTGLSSSIDGLAFNSDFSKIYWTENTKISRANPDGSNIEELVTGLSNVIDIAIDNVNSKMYWTDNGTDKVQRSDLDGSNVEDLITGLNSPVSIALDFGDSPLSVVLTSFSARQIENTIQLNWVTASETENEGFNVYRKAENGNFVRIASYKGNSELLGALNSTFSNDYTFVDNSELRNGETYTYYISDVSTNSVETKYEDEVKTVRFTLNEEVAQTKLDYILSQNFPNPFNPSTIINFQIAKKQEVNLGVYNLKGELVKELVNENLSKGSHSVNWDGADTSGRLVSSGTYFYKLTAGTFTQTNKMILLK